MENVVPKKSLTVCGKAWCQCTRIMANLEERKTPFFFANNNFTRHRGPRVPLEFVEEHGHEMYDRGAEQVTLEAAGKVFAVKLKIRSRNPGIIRLGLGWECFILGSRVLTEDLLIFTLEGQSRFAVTMVRGHNRRKDAETEVEPRKSKRKHGDTSESDDHEEGTSQWHAAKKLKLGQNSRPVRRSHRHTKVEPSKAEREGATSKKPTPVCNVVALSSESEPSDQGTKYVTRISSKDAFETYMLLDSNDSGNSAESSGNSNFEDESDFNEVFSE